MSFTKIAKIKRLGVFEDYSWKCSEDFKDINIFFGFNGSGKSILSNLFNLLARNENFPREKKSLLFEDLKRSNDAILRMSHSNGENLSYPQTGEQNNKNIFVFNTNFITEHVFDGQIGRIKKFNIAETVLEDPEIKKINLEIESITKEKEKNETDQQELLNKFVVLKQAYNSRFRESFPNKNLRIPNFPDISEIPQETKSQLEKELVQKAAEYKLSEKQSDLEKDIKSFSEIELESITIDFKVLDEILTKSAKEAVSETLKLKITNYQESIDAEDANSIEPWFKLGQSLLELSAQIPQKKCPLCDSDITARFNNIITDFSDYFDKKYEELSLKIKTQKEVLKKTITSIELNNSLINSLKKYQKKYLSILEDEVPNQSETTIIMEIKAIIDLLSEKQGNSSKVIEFDFINIKKKVLDYNMEIESYKTYQTKALKILRGQKLDSDVIESNIRKIYSRLIYVDLNSGAKKTIEKYHNLASRIETNSSRISALTNQKVQRLRDLKMESKKVSEYLKKLGITNFTIDLNESNESENILIKYLDDDRVKNRLRNTLSEGEKTALAFSYFLSKVTTEVKEKSQAYIVIDDPISSLDDNRLYNTAFLIFDEFKDFKQLFVLSHNLIFLKYLNPLFKPNLKAYYIINKGSIEDLPKSLQNFQSPYYYMIESLINFKDSDDPEYEEARKFLPNYIRRVLETFFSFKYAQVARERNKNQSVGLEDIINEIIDFQSLPSNSIGNISNENVKLKLSNINKICDNFSHGTAQQLDECNFISNEALREITVDTLDIISFFDSLHFNQVQKLIESPMES
jgi:wobble nucleotide-excising tRNase